MKNRFLSLLLLSGALLLSCQQKPDQNPVVAEAAPAFDYVVDQFADLRVLRYQVPGFDELSLKEKKLVYYLTQAGLAGRDIIWNQNYRHNLKIRQALENIYRSFDGDKTTADWAAFETYLKRVWFSK